MSAQVVSAAQDSVRDAVVAATSGRSAHRWVVPLAAVAGVAAAACAPVVWPLLAGAAVGSAALTAAFTQVGGVGGGLLAEAVVRAWDRLRGREGSSVGQSEFREALAVELKEALGSSLPMAAGLRAEVAGVLQGVDAVKVALTTTIETSVRESGDQVRAALISGLQDLGTRFTEFGWLLEEVNDQVTRIAETQAEIAAGTRAMLESQQQTLMRLTVLLQQTRPVHARDSALAGLPEATGAWVDEQRAAALDAAGVPVGSECPYPGLAAFGPQDADRFFGRQQLTATVVTRLAEQLTAPGLLMVLGPSGSGKSSLLRAGLLSAIAGGGLPARGSREWPVELMTPGRRPLLELATRIAAIAGIPAGGLNADMCADPARIAPAIRQALLTHTRREARAREPKPSVAVVGMDAADADAGYPADGPAPADYPDGGNSGRAGSSPRLVLIIDQFEEVFTQCADEQERRAFIGALCAAAGIGAAIASVPGRAGSLGMISSRDAPALVVIGMRADFYVRSVTYPELVPYLQDCQVLVGPMDQAGLRAAIEEPAALAGLAVDAGLVEVLLADLGMLSRPLDQAHAAGPEEAAFIEANGEPGSGNTSTDGGTYEAGRLPLLAYALQQTWQHRQGRRLTVAAYRATGGIDGAVARAADTVYDGLNTGGRQAARRLLLRLVSLGEGTADTRRRVAVAELTGTTEPAGPAHTPQVATTRTVLNDLIQARLLTADTGTDGSDTVEISHEALLSAWPKLHGWLSQDRSGQRTHRELTEAAHTWQAQDRDPSNLFTGTRLAVTREWAADHQQDLNPDEQAFLAACNQRVRASRLRRIGVMTLVVVLVLTAAVSSIALIQRNAAIQNARLQAIYNEITTEAGQLQITDPLLAGQLALVAYRHDRNPYNTSLLLVADNVPLPSRGTGPVQQVAFAGRILAVGRGDAIQLWRVTNLSHPTPLGQPLVVSATGILAMAFSPDGKLLAGGSADGTVRLWNVPAGRPFGASLNNFRGAIDSVAISPNGKFLAGGSVNGTVLLWDVATGRLTYALHSATGGAVDSVGFSPDGRTLVAGSTGGTVRLWHIPGTTGLPSPIGRPLISTHYISNLAITPDGRILAAGSEDGTVQLWNIANPHHATAIGRLLTVTTNTVNVVKFSSDGRTLVAGSEDGTVRLWNVTHPALATTIGLPVTDASPVLSAAYGPDGSTLAVGSQDGKVKLWNLDVNQAIERICAKPSDNLTRQQWAAYISQLPYDPPCHRR